MAKSRSPNYPSMNLAAALEAVAPAFRAENRNKMSRMVLAQHLGYTSLNGRALAKIGAVRAYGLIEGTGDELRISQDAIIALSAPDASGERRAAIERCALKPGLFTELRSDYPESLPSLENLRFNLVQRGFTQEAAGKAAESYLATMNLVSGSPASYIVDDDAGDDPAPASNPGSKSPPPAQNKRRQETNLMENERELTTGILSKDAGFRLIVNGRIGVKEIERLIRKLELDKEILADLDGDGDQGEDS